VSSPAAGTRGGGGACLRCLRRSWLLSQLSGPLDYCARDRGRLSELLALTDKELLQAVAGRRREELRARYAAFDADEMHHEPAVQALCRHHRGYPRALRTAGAPHLLHVTGGVGRLGELTAAPVVAIVGSRRASDYGIEAARSLGRGLAASGVTVTGALVDGIALAAHAGALEATGRVVAVMGGGLDVPCPARIRPLRQRITGCGCVVSELPCDCHGRRWGQLASERIVVGLAALTIVVEAHDTPEDLAAARTAQALGRTVAAVPGRVSSPLSQGAHTLLMGGANLVRGPADALELLYRIGVSSPAPAPGGGSTPHSALEPRLEQMLERVASGADTPDRLTSGGADAYEVLLALSELELMGLLRRGDSGRYVPCG
jgi:DNA processing protein